jgi:hypothetical protein
VAVACGREVRWMDMVWEEGLCKIFINTDTAYFNLLPFWLFPVSRIHEPCYFQTFKLEPDIRV